MQVAVWGSQSSELGNGYGCEVVCAHGLFRDVCRAMFSAIVRLFRHAPSGEMSVQVCVKSRQVSGEYLTLGSRVINSYLINIFSFNTSAYLDTGSISPLCLLHPG